MLRSFPLLAAMASLAAALFIAVAGARPVHIYDETWQGRAETMAAASPR